MALELSEHVVQAGDTYLLCSDGLNDMLSDGEIAQILTHAPPLAQAGQAAQAVGVVKIAQQRRDALGAQRIHTLGRRGQSQQAHTPLGRPQLARGALAHVATTHHQHAQAPKARRAGTDQIHAHQSIRSNLRQSQATWRLLASRFLLRSIDFQV